MLTYLVTNKETRDRLSPSITNDTIQQFQLSFFMLLVARQIPMEKNSEYMFFSSSINKKKENITLFNVFVGYNDRRKEIQKQ